MADAKIQATILVKKADGTTERITLEELKKRKQAVKEQANSVRAQPVSTPTPVSELPKIEPTVESVQRRTIPLVQEIQEKSEPVKIRRAIPLVEEVIPKPEPVKMSRAIPLIEETPVVIPTIPAARTESQVATTTPVTHVFEQPISITKPIFSSGKKVENTRSFLDEDHDEISALEKKHGTTHTPVTSVSFSSSVPIPKDLEARTNSLILSWKKGIRDKHQFLQYAVRAAGEGGLGLSQGNAEKLFLEISENAELKKPVAPLHHTPRPPADSLGLRPASIPQKRPMTQQIPNPPSLIREVASVRETSRVMGPTEEAGAFTLEDFRRLSRDSKVAGSMLLAKFSGWKDESYLLYLQVRDSWRRSPLFRLYIEQTVFAIERNVVITSALEGGSMNYDEYVVIADVNHKLGMMD